MKKNLFVFDVESASLFGKAFAVGATVFNRSGQEIDSFELLSTDGAELANQWVAENVLPYLKDMPKCKSRYDLRQAFYQFYLKHKDTCEFWGDCIFPVETNFLAEIVRDDLTREFSMPYPLKDISTMVDIEIDRVKECGISRLRKHNPLDDSRASMVFLLKINELMEKQMAYQAD